MFYIAKGDLAQIIKKTVWFRDGEAYDFTKEMTQLDMNYPNRPHRGCVILIFEHSTC